MEWRGKPAGPERRRLPSRQNEGDLVIPANLLLDAQPVVEIDQVGAAAEQHVLAVVDHLSCARQFVGGGTAAEERPAFEQLDEITGIGQSATGRQSCESAANDRYGAFGHTGARAARRILVSIAHRNRSQPFTMTASFSAGLSATRRVKTS